LSRSTASSAGRRTGEIDSPRTAARRAPSAPRRRISLGESSNQTLGLLDPRVKKLGATPYRSYTPWQDSVQLKSEEWLRVPCKRHQIGHLDFGSFRLLTERSRATGRSCAGCFRLANLRNWQESPGTPKNPKLTEGKRNSGRRVCKPDSVRRVSTPRFASEPFRPTRRGDHSSGSRIAPGLKRPTRGSREFTTRANSVRAGPALPSYLTLLHAGFSVPRMLPSERWALTPPFHPYPVHAAERGGPNVFPSACHRSALHTGGLFSVALSVAKPAAIPPE
jgi:hypothetical protein